MIPRWGSKELLQLLLRFTTVKAGVYVYLLRERLQAKDPAKR
jgi:hypothetical protein